VFVQSVGLNKNNVAVSIDTVAAFNKEYMEEQADRYFFIKDPLEISIENAPEKTIELNLHPHKRKGGRRMHTNTRFYVDKDDAEKFKEDQLIRLMDCLNFIQDGLHYKFVSSSYEEYKEKGSTIIHWLPVQDAINITIIMPDNTKLHGKGESNTNNIKEGDIIQFERFGFCRLDDKKSMTFWYTHQ
jgi:glutamyl-tRNA synthetase